MSERIDDVPDVIASFAEEGVGHDALTVSKDVDTDPATMKWACEEWTATLLRQHELHGLGVDRTPLPAWSKQRWLTERAYRLELTSLFQTVRDRLTQELDKAAARDKAAQAGRCSTPSGKPDGTEPPGVITLVIPESDQEKAKTHDDIVEFVKTRFGREVSKRTIQNHLSDGTVRSYMQGKLYVFSLSDLDTATK